MGKGPAHPGGKSAVAAPPQLQRGRRVMPFVLLYVTEVLNELFIFSLASLFIFSLVTYAIQTLKRKRNPSRMLNFHAVLTEQWELSSIETSDRACGKAAELQELDKIRLKSHTADHGPEPDHLHPLWPGGGEKPLLTLCDSCVCREV